MLGQLLSVRASLRMQGCLKHMYVKFAVVGQRRSDDIGILHNCLSKDSCSGISYILLETDRSWNGLRNSTCRDNKTKSSSIFITSA